MANGKTNVMLVKRKRLIFFMMCLLIGLMTPNMVNSVPTNEEQSLQLTWSKTLDNPTGYGLIPLQFLYTTGDPLVNESYFITGLYIVNGIEIPCFLKTDLNGDLVWNQSFIHPSKPQGLLRSLVQTSDGGFALSGWIKSSLGNDYNTYDLWIIKTDGDGVEVWNRTFNGQKDSFDYGSQILETPDGGFLISGCTGAAENWEIDYWLIKLNGNGTEIWNKTYHRIGADQATALVPLSGGNFLISGLSSQYSTSENPHSIWVIKIDENGTVIWDKVFSKGTETLGAWERNLVGTNDGGFILSYYQRASLHVGKDYLVVKVDQEGEVEWEKTIGGDDYDTPSACLQNEAGDYYIGGSYDSSEGEYETGDFCLTKLSSSGEILWQQKHGDRIAGETIVDMRFINGVNSNDTIGVCGQVNFAGDYSSAKCWLGRYEYVKDIDKQSSSSGIIVLSLGLGIITLFCKKRLY
ncbi:MAG: hypothetical protein ACFFB2_01590 [Promethearchaeota archaeon]